LCKNERKAKATRRGGEERNPDPCLSKEKERRKPDGRKNDSSARKTGRSPRPGRPIEVQKGGSDRVRKIDLAGFWNIVDNKRDCSGRRVQVVSRPGPWLSRKRTKTVTRKNSYWAPVIGCIRGGWGKENWKKREGETKARIPPGDPVTTASAGSEKKRATLREKTLCFPIGRRGKRKARRQEKANREWIELEGKRPQPVSEGGGGRPRLSRITPGKGNSLQPRRPKTSSYLPPKRVGLEGDLGPEAKKNALQRSYQENSSKKQGVASF